MLPLDMEPQKQQSSQTWRIHDRNRFLSAVMEHLAGTASISFEGDLSSTELSMLPGAAEEETPALRRNTLWPRQGFVIVPLTADSIRSIQSAMGGTIPKSIFHIQIEKDGRLELGLYDHFHPETIFFGAGIPADFLERLQIDGIVMAVTADKAEPV